MSDPIPMPLELLIPLHNWALQRAGAFDVVALLITAILLTRGSWSPVFFKPAGIPREFWYQVPQSTGTRALSREKKAEARNIAHVFEVRKLDMLIFWGSQSGRGELLARQFARGLQDRYGLRTLAADSDDFDFEHLAQLKESQVCGFVLSTYGDGDPPDNANGLWSFLHNTQRQGTDLRSLRYILFGLGNSSYRQYNHVAETVDSILRKTGARRFGEAGVGDDAHGETEMHFLSWKRETYRKLEVEMGLKEQKRSYQPAFDVQYDDSIATESISVGEPHLSSPSPRSVSMRTAESKQPVPLPVIYAKRLWESEQRLCLHMDLDLGEGRKLKYKTGDHLAIWPCNPEHEVRRLIALTGYSGKQHRPISVKLANDSGHGKLSVPSLTTVEGLFRHYLEISGQLSPETIAALAEFAPSVSSAAKLRGMGEDIGHFRTAVLARRMTLADLLEEIEADSLWHMPLSFLLERLKPMQPRYYSISSSASVHPRIVSITVVVDKPPKVADNTSVPWQGCYGLATSYLWALEKSKHQGTEVGSDTHNLSGPRGLLEGGKIFANVRHSAFKLPTKSSSPIIMVGAGTGIAPFRAFVQERAHRKQIGEEVGMTLLFMGFRNSGTDFIYEEEWESWKKALGTDRFRHRTAFSRDDGSNKVYVQDLLREDASELMELLEAPGCRFYICGSASMARDVVSTLASLRAEATGELEGQAMEWARRLRQYGTLLEDVWG